MTVGGEERRGVFIGGAGDTEAPAEMTTAELTDIGAYIASLRRAGDH